MTFPSGHYSLCGSVCKQTFLLWGVSDSWRLTLHACLPLSLSLFKLSHWVEPLLPFIALPPSLPPSSFLFLSSATLLLRFYVSFTQTKLVINFAALFSFEDKKTALRRVIICSFHCAAKQISGGLQGTTVPTKAKGRQALKRREEKRLRRETYYGRFISRLPTHRERASLEKAMKE